MFRFVLPLICNDLRILRILFVNTVFFFHQTEFLHATLFAPMCACSDFSILPLTEEALKRSRAVSRNQLNAVAFSYDNPTSGTNLETNSSEPSEINFESKRTLYLFFSTNHIEITSISDVSVNEEIKEEEVEEDDEPYVVPRDLELPIHTIFVSPDRLNLT